MVLLGSSDGILVGLPIVEVNAGILLDGLDHGQTLPVAHVDLLALVGDFQAATDLQGQALVHLLDQVHHAVEIGESLVQLDGGELRVMLGVHALVAEDTADLVHAVHTADDQALQIQLGLDAQHHVHIQRVVVGIERAGGGADLKGGQDGGVDLQEALLVQVSADLLQDLAALDEGVFDLGVDDEVNIALTIAGLAVGQTVELLGQGQQALGEQRQLGDADGDLAHFGAEHFALDTDDIADVQLFEGGVRLIAQQVTLDEDLDIALLVTQVGKAGLAHDAFGHHAASQRDDLAGLGFGGQVGKLSFQISGVRILRIFGDDKGVAAGGAQVGQLLAANGCLLADVLFGLGLILLHVRSSFRVFKS